LDNEGSIMEITGNTRIVGLFGYPVRHTLSPAMQNAAFEALRLDYAYLPFEVSPDDLEDAVKSLAALGIAGVNVTIPHKERVIPLLDEVSEKARLIGSVNTIQVKDRRLIGYNTDAYGFGKSLSEEGGMDPASKKIFVMGAGGVSRAICFQCALSGAKELVIADLDPERSRALGKAVSASFPACGVEICGVSPREIEKSVSGKDLFINATPVGMKPDDPPLIRTEWLETSTVVFDVIYNPAETRLLHEAKARGLSTINGTGMLVYQGARAFELFTGMKPPVETMFRVFKTRFSS